MGKYYKGDDDEELIKNNFREDIKLMKNEVKQYVDNIYKEENKDDD